MGPPPLTLQVDRSTGLVTIANTTDADIAIAGYSITSAGGQLAPDQWNSFADQAVGGWSESQTTANALAESTFGRPRNFAAGGGAAGIGTPFVGEPISFRIDAPADLEFEYTTGGETRTGKVEYAGVSLNNLTLLVDPESGLARLENTSPFAVAIDGYTITSASQSLDAGDWQSLQDQAAANGQWSEANPTTARLSELQATGDTPLAPGDSFELGQLFDPTGEQDLVFDFLLAGDSTTLRGVVLFAEVRLTGDFNDDGIVDAADYPLWRDSLGQQVALGSGADGDRDGQITTADYDVWRANFGRALASVGSGACAPVPEPAAIWLLVALLRVPIRFSRRP